MNYTKKSFSVSMGAKSKEFADRWEQTFGKKEQTTRLEPIGEVTDLPYVVQEQTIGGPLAAHLAASGPHPLEGVTVTVVQKCILCGKAFTDLREHQTGSHPEYVFDGARALLRKR